MSSHDSFKASRNSPTRKKRIAIPQDFTVENHGSTSLLRPLNDSGRAWIAENIGEQNGYQPYYPTVIAEPRYLADILTGIQRDGLVAR